MHCLVHNVDNDEWLSAQVSNLTSKTAVLNLETVMDFGTVITVNVSDISIQSTVVYSSVAEKVCVIAFNSEASNYEELKASLEKTRLKTTEHAPEDEGSDESTDESVSFDVGEDSEGDFYSESTAFQSELPDQSTRKTIAAPPPIRLDDQESTDASMEMNSPKRTLPPTSSAAQLLSPVALSTPPETSEASVQQDPFPSLDQSGHDLEVQLRRPSAFFIMPELDDEIDNKDRPENLTNGEASLVDPSCLPVLLDEDSLVLFQTNRQFLWHYDRHIRNCGLVVDATGLSLGSKHQLGLTILGTEIMVRVQAQVCYIEDGMVGFMLPDDNEHRSMMRGVVHLCRP